MPPLLEWLRYFALPSVVSIVVTYALLRFSQRASLAQEVADLDSSPRLTTSGKIAAAGIAATAVVLIAASGLGRDLGLPTLIAAWP